VFENGSSVNGKLIPVGDSLDMILEQIRSSFGCPDFKYIFTAKGGQVESVDLIRDDEVLFASKGEPFIPRGQVAGNIAVPVHTHRQTFHNNFSAVHKSVESCMEWVKLNVGGQLFYTSRTTLLNREPESMLARMFDPDSNIRPSCVDQTGAFLIDRDPKYFTPILNFLRTGNLILDPDVNPNGVLEEANFFGIQTCVPMLEEMLTTREDIPLTRRESSMLLLQHQINRYCVFRGLT